MNYHHNDELIEGLAQRYVTGLMRGQARARFRSLVSEYPRIAQQVTLWEQHLNGLADQLKPMQPQPKVWQNIQQRLFTPTRTSNPFWRIFGGLAAVTAAVLLIVVIQLQTQIPEVPAVDRIALIKDEQQLTLWVLNVKPDSIKVTPQPNVEARNDKDYELWMLPKDGSAPVSLGLLPESSTAKALDPPAEFQLAQVGALAVSLEPTGGSTTGAPTGPVLYTTDIITL
tara:strand:+ start:623 stop:1303 length:681 start_codon:yes stop_codon:yes gene_type:complete